MRWTMLLPALLFGVTTLASAADPAATTTRVSVEFIHPETFTDVREFALPSEKDRADLLGELAAFIRTAGESYLPPGHRLEVRVTNVDMAGEFEPARGPQFDRIRLMREIYPPRIDLEFTLRDGSGGVVTEGRRELRDMNYLLRPVLPQGDRLRYEKDLLRDWLRGELSRAS